MSVLELTIFGSLVKKNSKINKLNLEIRTVSSKILKKNIKLKLRFISNVLSIWSSKTKINILN